MRMRKVHAIIAVAKGTMISATKVFCQTPSDASGECFTQRKSLKKEAIIKYWTKYLYSGGPSYDAYFQQALECFAQRMRASHLKGSIHKICEIFVLYSTLCSDTWSDCRSSLFVFKISFLSDLSECACRIALVYSSAFREEKRIEVECPIQLIGLSTVEVDDTGTGSQSVEPYPSYSLTFA